ncbi:unnamed protein product [Pipistrellus nathusii]|uniref:Uncharacterized protein n=1 Tax=Pipistrellus nathusii TaxID=59473 RepID=A0ABN9ZT32_PIPNA
MNGALAAFPSSAGSIRWALTAAGFGRKLVGRGLQGGVCECWGGRDGAGSRGATAGEGRLLSASPCFTLSARGWSSRDASSGGLLYKRNIRNPASGHPREDGKLTL